MADVTISLRNIDEERTLLGHLDRNLRILREQFEIDAISRAGQLTLAGQPDKLERAAEMVRQALGMIRESDSDAGEIADLFQGAAASGKKGGGAGDGGGYRYAANPRSPNQRRYMDAIRDNPVTFGLGPAGTGKTFLAVAMAVTLVKAGDFRKIVLVRPAVEAGEHLGFLPGDLEAKIAPYLRPLHDALQALLPKALLKRFLDEAVIEISPLAYMRGRTLNHSVIILDEAQNTTIAQMKMFLTRMGDRSKIIVTGDPSQIDLPGNQASGLIHALRVLRGVEGLAFAHLAKEDIVRHEVVQRIVKAYGSWEEAQRQREADERREIEDERERLAEKRKRR